MSDSNLLIEDIETEVLIDDLFWIEDISDARDIGNVEIDYDENQYMDDFENG